MLVGRGTANAEWVEWIADAEVLYSSKDNINNAVNGATKESVRVWTPSVSFGRIYQLTDFSRLIITADASAASHSEFTLLDNQTFGGTLAVRHKFGIGPLRPWIRANVSAASIDSRSELRDGQQYVAGVSAGKRIHERVDLFFGYTHDDRFGPDRPPPAQSCCVPALMDKSGSVYNLRGNKLSAGVNILITDRTLIAVGYSSRSGDIAATCDSATATLLVNEITAITDDDALPGCAYRANADTNAYTVDLSYAFYGGHAAINIGFEAAESTVGTLSYKNNNANVSINYSY